MMHEEKRYKKPFKCQATGKAVFTSRGEAYTAIMILRWRFHFPRKRPDGSRVKRRMKKRPAQRRVYYCIYCEGYHLTKLTKGQYEKSKRAIWR